MCNEATNIVKLGAADLKERLDETFNLNTDWTPPAVHLVTARTLSIDIGRGVRLEIRVNDFGFFVHLDTNVDGKAPPKVRFFSGITCETMHQVMVAVDVLVMTAYYSMTYALPETSK